MSAHRAFQKRPHTWATGAPWPSLGWWGGLPPGGAAQTQAGPASGARAACPHPPQGPQQPTTLDCNDDRSHVLALKDSQVPHVACLGQGRVTQRTGRTPGESAYLPCTVKTVGCECEFDLSCPHSVRGESPEDLLCPQSCLHGLCGGARATVRATRGRGGSKQKPGQRGQACFTAASGRVRAPRPTPGTPARPLLGRLKRWAAGQQLPLHQERLVCAIWCHQR